MSDLRLGGLISGMDTEDVIRRIMDLENTRVLRQQDKRSALQEKQAAWRQVRSSLETLRTKLDGIRFAGQYQSRVASLSDETVAKVTAASGAALTTHNLVVNTLAQSHVVAGGQVPDPNAPLNRTGTITIRGVMIQVNTNDSLNSLRDKIQKATGTGVTPEVVKVMAGSVVFYRLVLTAQTQGTAGAITMVNPDMDSTLLQDLGFQDAENQWITEISQAQDASFTLNGVDYVQSSNVVADVLPNLTITLQTAGTTSITVSKDADQLVRSVQEWVDSLNDTIALLKEQTKYDPQTGEKGLLNGDSTARSLLTKLKSVTSTVVAELPDTLNRMSQVGITSGAWGTADYGKILLDKNKLKEQVLADEDGVARLFGALRTNVALDVNGAEAVASSTALGSYDAADVLNGDVDSDRFGTVGGGWQSEAAPTAVDPQWLEISFGGTKTIDQVRIFQPNTETYPAATAGLKDYTLEYQDTEGQWHELMAVTNHTGASKTLDFAPVTANKVRVSVTATYGTDNPARISEIQVHQVNNGPAIQMFNYVSQALAYGTGMIHGRDNTLTQRIQDIDKTIQRLNEQMEAREKALRLQFARMEDAMSRLQNQGNAFMAQMLGGWMTGQ